MARASWSGALTLAGLPIHVRIYPRVKSRSGESFKRLAPTDQLPVKQQLVDTSGAVHEQAACLSGVEVGKGSYKALPPEAIELIGSAERSSVLEPEQFCPLASVPLELTLTSYAMTPDEKVPGSDMGVKIVWNGLRKGELAYVTQITPRAGSRDSVLVIWGDADGLYANTLPFAAELQQVPEWDMVEDEQQAATFEAFVQAQYAEKIGAFDHSVFESGYKQRRAEAVQAALAGETIVVPEVETAKAAVPDLMAAMQASIAQAPAAAAKKAPAAKPAPAKPAKKASKKSKPVKA